MEAREGEKVSKDRAGGRKESLCPAWRSPPRTLPPTVTLARMSMVVQVSISCMDTGVCPSALPSRISTSCSAFSLNVSIKLTKELGTSTQISGHWDRPRAAAALQEASVQGGSDDPSQPVWSPGGSAYMLGW